MITSEPDQFVQGLRGEHRGDDDLADYEERMRLDAPLMENRLSLGLCACPDCRNPRKTGLALTCGDPVCEGWLAQMCDPDVRALLGEKVAQTWPLLWGQGDDHGGPATKLSRREVWEARAMTAALAALCSGVTALAVVGLFASGYGLPLVTGR